LPPGSRHSGRSRHEAATLLRWALAFAAAGGFAPLLFGLWWRRCNEVGGIGAAVAGFGCTLVAFALDQGLVPGSMVMSGLAGLGPTHAAIFGTAISIAVAVCVSLATPPPEGDLGELFDTLGGRRRQPLIRERPV
jgi:Na+(H+)/acetate symporter ActP